MAGRDRIIVLDFGSQYTHLLARRVRELGVYSQIMSPTSASDEFKGAGGIILSGGPKSVYDKDAVAFNPKIFSSGIPVLGLCYGEQLIGEHLGGKVTAGRVKEYGKAVLEVVAGELFEGTPKQFTVWMSHGDQVSELPEGFETSASTSDCPNAAIADPEKRIYGLQFHPEVTHTQNGMKILANFVFRICGCKKGWTMENYLNEKISDIRTEVDDRNVFLLLSGGVDSTVSLALLGRAIGSARIHALHVDTGFMRKGESEYVEGELEKLGIQEVHVVDASGEFIQKLEGVADPEEKRSTIGKLFVDIAMRELNNLSFDTGTWLLGQGTIYPDTIETGGTENSNKIKTHHNRAPIIMEMIEQGLVVEPLKELYKDEVRELGMLLGLPSKLVKRHPFPGPGLAIRILCSNGKEKVDKGLEEKINKITAPAGYLARVLAVRAVGVQGDNRTYRNVVVLVGKLDYNALEEISTRVTNAFSTINRVVVLLEPEKIESAPLLEEAYLSTERIERLREADAIAMDALEEKGAYDKVWQFPVVLLPVKFNNAGEGIVLRPVESREAMTATFAKLDPEIISEMAQRVLKVRGVGAVMLDVTHKPPATIEWE